jgi:sugar phosphate isomerase/epimerase
MIELGLFTDSVEKAPFEEALDLAAEIGATGLEIAVAGASTMPHANRAALLADAGARRRFTAAISSRGLRLAALNCSGFPLHPVIGAAERRSIEETIRLAGELGVDKIVTMSGCPGDGVGATTLNWIWYPWPEDAVALLERQWDEAIPFWQEMARLAARHGVRRIAFELHPLYLVYNVPTLFRLRSAVGDVVGANLDPSHLFWQQMDPLAVIRALGPAIHHVHLKDTAVIPDEVAIAGVLDVRPFDVPEGRAWNFRTVGRGHDATFWQAFVTGLVSAGYAGSLSIEHEDRSEDPLVGVTESAAFIQTVLDALPAGSI